MTAIEVGQWGSGRAGRKLPGPDTAEYHLATLLGMMTGDRYAPSTMPETDLVLQAADASPKPSGATGGVLAAAAKYLGTPYVYGATDPKKGLDCSSFVQRAFADVGVNLPRVTYDQVKMGVGVDRNSLQPGDLIFFIGDKGNRTNGHVGIYTGNGMMIDAPHTGAKVGYRTVNWRRVTAMRRVT